MSHAEPLMPKATAVWLIDNTTLTFAQIAAFCRLHLLEVEAIANGEIETHTRGISPVATAQTTAAAIAAAEADPSQQLVLLENKDLQRKTTGGRYTPLKKRQIKPEGIAWLVKTYPELSTTQIVRLLGTTAGTVESIRAGKYARTEEIHLQNPVSLGLTSELELAEAVNLARQRAERKEQKVAQRTKKGKKDQKPDSVAVKSSL